MKRAVCKQTVNALLVVLVVSGWVGCGLKTRESRETVEPTPVEKPVDEEQELPDLDADRPVTEPLPLGTEFLPWRVEIDSAPRPGRIEDSLTRTLTFTLTNTLDRTLTGQILVEAPTGVLVIPGTTIGWRLRGDRTAAIPAQLTIIEGAPLGRITLPVSLRVLDQEYGDGRLDVTKWFDVRTLGPFPVEESEELVAAVLSDDAVQFDKGVAWQGTTYEWRPLPVDQLQPDGLIDFSQLYGEAATGCAFAAWQLHAEAATGVVLALAADSPTTVWLNGEQVLEAPAALEVESIAEVVLRKGDNVLCVRCDQGESAWRFTLNVTGKLGLLPAGVRFDLVLRGTWTPALSASPDHSSQ